MASKFVLNGVEFSNFGSNNYSNGMECITAYSMPEDMVERILNGEFHGVWLNPSCDLRGSSEFYGVFGTPEQYYGDGEDNEGFYASQKESQISSRVIKSFGSLNNFLKASEEERKEAYKKYAEEYKDWWL